MYLRARARTNAHRRRVEGAEALTSARRIWEDPALYFSTAGFPRERGWIDALHARVEAGAGVTVQIEQSVSSASREAIRYRIGHNLVLFAVLPRLISRILDNRCAEPEALQAVLGGRDPFTIRDLCERPGLLLVDLLASIDDSESNLQPLLDTLADTTTADSPGLHGTNSNR